MVERVARQMLDVSEECPMHRAATKFGGQNFMFILEAKK